VQTSEATPTTEWAFCFLVSFRDCARGENVKPGHRQRGLVARLPGARVRPDATRRTGAAAAPPEAGGATASRRHRCLRCASERRTWRSVGRPAWCGTALPASTLQAPGVTSPTL